MQEQRLVFIGGGNMATSLIGGLLAEGYPASQISACDPDEVCRQRLEKTFAIRTHASNDAARDADVLILAVKPQVLEPIARDIGDKLAHSPLTISIAAGIPVSALQAWLGTNVPIVRCMPNTPALVQQGATALYATALVSADQRALAQQVLAAAGTTCWCDNETDIDRVTALSGSGPAYFFLVMEAMEDAGVKLGLNRDTARQLTLQTALGAATLALADDAEPAELRRRVTSPGGTTEAAINVMLQGGLPSLFEQAIAAAYQRAVEMAKESS